MLSVSVFSNPDAAMRLVVSHGNGLAAMGYRRFWEPLLRDFEIVTLDMRGHGASEAGGVAQHTWEQFEVDLQTVIGAVSANDARPLIGAFHSLSAVNSLVHLRRHSGAPPWRALVLFDPPLTAPAGSPCLKTHQREMAQLAQTTARRRRTYASLEERIAQFERTEVFGRWVPGATRDMAEATLRAVPGQAGWELSCDPVREAYIYQTCMRPLAWKALREPPCPIALVAGDPTLERAGGPAQTCRLAGQTLPVHYEAVPGTGHFLQLEKPEACQNALRRFVGQL